MRMLSGEGTPAGRLGGWWRRRLGARQGTLTLVLVAVAAFGAILLLDQASAPIRPAIAVALASAGEG